MMLIDPHRFTTSPGSVGTWVEEVTADSPVAWWRLGEASRTSPAADEIGSNDGTYLSGTTGVITPGVTGAIIGDPDTAVRFDGNNDRIDLPSLSSLITGDFTIELWFKPNAAFGAGSTARTPFCASDTNDSLIYVGEITGLATDEVITVFDDSWRAAWVDGTATVDTSWHHLVVTWDGSAYQIYLDGEVKPMTVAGTPAALDFGDPFIGGKDDAYDWHGDIDEVALYGSALSSARVAAHYEAAGY